MLFFCALQWIFGDNSCRRVGRPPTVADTLTNMTYGHHETGPVLWAHSATQDGHYFTFVDHSGISTIHCAPWLLWSSRWCSKCVLVFRRAVDHAVVLACGGGADPHSHGALGWVGGVLQHGSVQDDSQQLMMPSDPLMEENCTLLSHSLALVRFLRQFSARDPGR